MKLSKHIWVVLIYACQPWVPESLPVTVEIDSTMPEVFITNSKNAFTTWNGMSGVEVFKVEVKKLSKDGCNKIQLTTAEYDIKKKYGSTFYTYCGAEIYLAKEIPVAGIQVVTEHEAGHAIGIFDHDPDPSSIMYKNWLGNGAQLFTPAMLNYVREGF